MTYLALTTVAIASLAGASIKVGNREYLKALGLVLVGMGCLVAGLMVEVSI